MKRVHLLVLFLFLIACASLALSSALANRAMTPNHSKRFAFIASAAPSPAASIPVGSPTPAASPPLPLPTPWPGAVIEKPIEQLGLLLSPLGISVIESKLIEVHRVTSYRTLIIEWKSYRDAPELVDYETPNFEHINELRVLDSIAREGGMQAIRIPTIAKDQIFALGINDRSELLWWTRIGDPRVVRKETADSEGRMQARLYHESTTQIWIDVPDSDDISEVRLYLPGSGPGHVVLVPLYTVPFHISQ